MALGRQDGPRQTIDDFVCAREAPAERHAAEFAILLAAGGILRNQQVVNLEGDTRRTVKVGEPLALSARVTDDGRLKPFAAPGGNNRTDTAAYSIRARERWAAAVPTTP